MGLEGPILLTGTHSVGTVIATQPLTRPTIDATEEAVVNAMLASQTMTGADGIRLFNLPGERVVAALRKYNRMK